MFSKKSYLFISLSLLLLFACSKEEEGPQKEFGTGKVNFSDLKIGQQSTYVHYAGICIDDPPIPGIDIPLGDTLILEVVDMNDRVITLSERMSEGSTLYQAGLTRTVEYNMVEHEDFLLIPIRDSSALFYFYANDTIHLRPRTTINLEGATCFLSNADTIFTGDDIGIINDFRVFDKVLEEQIAVSCLPPFIFTFESAYLLYTTGGLTCSYTVLSSSNPSSPAPRREGWVEIAALE